MGFWSFLNRKKPGLEVLLMPASGPPSPRMEKVLADAAKRPLDDHTFRMAIVLPHNEAVVDVGLFALDSAFTTHKKTGLKNVRSVAVAGLVEALKGREVDEKFVGFMALAYFDTEFTVGANRGKTYETAWNTLTLEVEVVAQQVRVTRGAVRIEYPEGPIDLSFDAFTKMFR
jgi:hypothetical protein